MKIDIINKFLFAEDCALNATTEVNMQNSVHKCFSGLWQLWPNHQHKKRHKWCTNQHLENHMLSPTSLSRDNRKWYKSSPTSAAPSPNLSLRMTGWMLDSQKWVQPLADSTGMCGIGEAFWRQPKSRYIKLSFLPPSFMAVKHGLLIKGI